MARLPSRTQGPAPDRLMGVIYHITSSGDWPPGNGVYRGPTLHTEGFIHCSTADQLIGVANRLFRGRADLVVLVLDVTRIRSKIVHENLEGGSEMFPHVYGPLDIDAVIRCVPLKPSSGGSFTAPEGMLAPHP